MEVCEANLLMVAIYFRLPAIWDENFILNEERIRHNEVISKKTINFFEKIPKSCTGYILNEITLAAEFRQIFEKIVESSFKRSPDRQKLVYLSDWPIFDAHDVNKSNEMVQRNKKY